MNPLLESVLGAAGEVFQAVETAAHEIEPTQAPAPETVQPDPVAAEVAQGIQAIGEIAQGNAEQGVHDAATLAANAIAKSNPDGLHERVTAAESWMAKWEPVLGALAKEFGIEPNQPGA